MLHLWLSGTNQVLISFYRGADSNNENDQNRVPAFESDPSKPKTRPLPWQEPGFQLVS
jgi:hypothetical protein